MNRYEIASLRKMVLPLFRLNSFLLIAGVVAALCLVPNWSRADQLSLSGLTEPGEDSVLGLSTIGRVTKIHAKEGEPVKQGQLLLELDQKMEQLEVERRKLIWESRAEIESVSLQVKTLAQHLQSTRDLYQSTGSVPLEELQNKELEYAFAVAEQTRLEIAEQREKNEYATARQQLIKRNLYAPFSGQVAEIMIGVGENCETDTALIRLVDTSRGYFVAHLELPISQQLRLNEEVELHFNNGLATVRLPAQISFISPLLDPASGLRKIKATFLNKEGLIVPGTAGQLQLERTATLQGETSGHN